MTKTPWHPGSLLQLSGSYWEAFTLHTGVKLDVFTLLVDTPMRAEDLAVKVGADVRGIRMLLNALAAMNLIRKQADVYHATEAAEQFLNRDSDAYIGHMILHHHHLAESWARLNEAVRSGTPIRSRVTLHNDERREAFLLGMYNIASQQAPQIAAMVDLSDRKRLLDLGGGPGTYAIHFCRQYRHLEATIYDLPTTQPFAEKTVAKHGLSDRIRFVAGDFTTETIPGRFDAVWMSHILHAEGPETCERIIAKAAGCLAPGGLMLVHDFMLNSNMDGPLFPALFALNMLQGTSAGQSYSESQIKDMLQRNGIIDIERMEYTGPTESGILVGTLP